MAIGPITVLGGSPAIPPFGGNGLPQCVASTVGLGWPETVGDDDTLDHVGDHRTPRPGPDADGDHRSPLAATDRTIDTHQAGRAAEARRLPAARPRSSRELPRRFGELDGAVDVRGLAPVHSETGPSTAGLIGRVW